MPRKPTAPVLMQPMSAPTRRGAPFSCPRERKHSAYAWATSSEAGRSLKGPSSPNALMAQWTSQGLSARRASYPRPRESALPGARRQTPVAIQQVEGRAVTGLGEWGRVRSPSPAISGRGPPEPRAAVRLVGVPRQPLRHGVSPLEGLLLEQTVAAGWPATPRGSNARGWCPIVGSHGVPRRLAAPGRGPVLADGGWPFTSRRESRMLMQSQEGR